MLVVFWHNGTWKAIWIAGIMVGIPNHFGYIFNSNHQMDGQGMHNDVATEREVTGAVAKALRDSLGLTQKAFWTPIGLTQSGGSRYEGKKSIPRPIRILLFTMYVAGLKLDATSKDGASGLVRLANLQSSELAPDAAKIGEKIAEAKTHIRKASTALSSITG